METISQILQGGGYLLLLVVLTVLWNRTFRWQAAGMRAWQFWGLLALAWMMNLLGNIAWAIYDLVSGTTLDTFSAVDLFYVLRYVLIGAALWQYPKPLTGRAWIWVAITAVVTNVLIWAVYFRPAMALRGGTWTDFLGVAMYPALDAAMIVLAWLRVRDECESLWGRKSLFLFFAVTCYGIANTLNLISYVFSVMTDGLLPNVFWVSTDLFLLAMALTYGGVKKTGAAG